MPFMEFPEFIKLNIGSSVDDFVSYLNKTYSSFFDVIQSILLSILSSVQFVLNLIPWWLLILLVFFLGLKISGHIRRGLLYSSLLFLVGALGLWEMMNLTLSVVITSVIISLLIGLPLGILISAHKTVGTVARPLLDAMQTMPTFVYLIPAVMFFGLGMVPAVIATTIYAVPPVIRLTSHAINHVSHEMVEAAKAFGSTRFQLLTKVQLPQALPTIMAGVNQTIMMAVAMVVTSAMIGARGLGMEVLIGINRLEIGRGFTSGVAIVIMAVLFDRLTQGWFKDKQGQKQGEE